MSRFLYSNRWQSNMHLLFQLVAWNNSGFVFAYIHNGQQKDDSCVLLFTKHVSVSHNDRAFGCVTFHVLILNENHYRNKCDTRWQRQRRIGVLYSPQMRSSRCLVHQPCYFHLTHESIAHGFTEWSPGLKYLSLGGTRFKSQQRHRLFW
jgi:hypothetical protein